MSSTRLVCLFLLAGPAVSLIAAADRSTAVCYVRMEKIVDQTNSGCRQLPEDACRRNRAACQWSSLNGGCQGSVYAQCLREAGRYCVEVHAIKGEYPDRPDRELKKFTCQSKDPVEVLKRMPENAP